MVDRRRRKWRRAIPRSLRLEVSIDRLLDAVFHLADRFDWEGPRPLLERITAMLPVFGIEASPRTVTRRFLRILGRSFRDFVTHSILTWAKKGLSQPGASVKRVWWLLCYRWGRAVERLFARYLQASPRRFLPAPT